MIRTVDIEINAANPNLPLASFQAYVTSPSSVRIRNVPRRIGTWEITSVQLTVNYPDNTSRSAVCKLTAGVWVGTVAGSTSTGTSTNGYAITASGTDENGYAVTGYILGKGDVLILATDGTITVGETTYYVHLLDAQPTTPKKGDLCKIGGAWKLYTGSAWESFGSGGGDVSHSDFTDVTTITDRYTLADVKGKVNEVLNILKGSALSILALLSAPLALALTLTALPVASFAAIEPQTARLDALYNDSLVVTNVTGSSGLTTNDVCAIVTNIASSAAVTNAGAVVAATNAAKAYADEIFLAKYYDHDGNCIYWGNNGRLLTGAATILELGGGFVTYGTILAKAGWHQFQFNGQTLPDYLASTEWHGSNKTLADYGITNAYSKSEVDSAIENASVTNGNGLVYSGPCKSYKFTLEDPTWFSASVAYAESSSPEEGDPAYSDATLTTRLTSYVGTYVENATFYHPIEGVTAIQGAGNYSQISRDTAGDVSISARLSLDPAATNALASQVSGLASSKRDLTNNVCAADSFAYSAWSKENLPSGVTWDDQPYIADDGLWTWHYVDGSSEGYSQGEQGEDDNDTFQTFGYGEGFTSTRTATPIALSNDIFTTYCFVTNAVATATPDFTTNNSAFVKGVTNVVDAAVLEMVAQSANTNAVAILNETLGKDWTTYGGGLAGLLAAILAALALLKKSKANISDFTLGSFASYVSSLFSGDNASLNAAIDAEIASRCASLDPATSSIADIINALKGTN